MVNVVKDTPNSTPSGSSLPSKILNCDLLALSKRLNLGAALHLRDTPTLSLFYHVGPSHPSIRLMMFGGQRSPEVAQMRA